MLKKHVSSVVPVQLEHLYTGRPLVPDISDKCVLTRLEQLGSGVTGRAHSTSLKYRILAYVPDMEACKQGREVVLVCNEEVGSAMRRRVKVTTLSALLRPLRRHV